MAVSYNGGVIMGADSRTSTGSYIANRVSDKITSIYDNIYVCRSGSAADTQALADYVRRFTSEHAIEKNSLPTVAAVAKLFRTLAYENKDRLLAGLIIGGYDHVDGGSVYEVPLGGSLVKQNVSIGGSGSSYIYGYVDANYKPNMTKEEAITLVKTAISHAMARDGSSGGVIRLVIIDKDGITKEFVPGDKLPYMLY
jgi:20S proteasome subunit beta 1